MRFSKLSFAVLGVMCAMGSVVGAGQQAGRSEEIVVLDAEFHHIGDSVINEWVVPVPEGTYLEIPFWLTHGQIEAITTAHLDFFLLHNSWSHIIVNGRRYSLPETENMDARFLAVAAKTLFSIPPSFLKAGPNWLVFEAMQHGTNVDDLEIGDVVLILSY